MCELMCTNNKITSRYVIFLVSVYIDSPQVISLKYQLSRNSVHRDKMQHGRFLSQVLKRYCACTNCKLPQNYNSIAAKSNLLFERNINLWKVQFWRFPIMRSTGVFHYQFYNNNYDHISNGLHSFSNSLDFVDLFSVQWR